MAAEDEARDALYRAIKEAAGEVNKWGAKAAAPALRDLAIGWRALAGGQQPGSVVVEGAEK